VTDIETQENAEPPSTVSRMKKLWWTIPVVALLVLSLAVVTFLSGWIPGFGPRPFPARQGGLFLVSPGIGEGLDKVTFTRLSSFPYASDFDFGAEGNVFVLQRGEVWSWGPNNDSGQLGSGDILPVDQPIVIEGLPEIRSISAGMVDAYALDTAGQLWGWGQNLPLPAGYSASDSLVPVPIPGLPPIESFVSGEFATYALDTSGTVWGWGWDVSRLFGNDDDQGRLAVKIPELDHITSVSASEHVGLALKDDGTVWAWGYSPYGEIGDGTVSQLTVPVQVPDLTNVVSIARGSSTSYAVQANGTAYCWGSNYLHQCGVTGADIDDGVMFLTPTVIAGPASLHHIIATNSMAYGFSEEGLWAWGQGWGATLVESSEENLLPVPASLPDLPGFLSIAEDESHTMVFFTK
jgi:alpha-tubulin suppressor-like RCC1 family protein